MTGIILISHGSMADGVKDALSMFFGDDIPQLETLSLRLSDSADQFGKALRETIAAVDSGDGVIILADLLGGTPCNQALQVVSDNVSVITGMNLPMAIEFVGSREPSSSMTPSELVEVGKLGILDAGALLLKDTPECEDDD